MRLGTPKGETNFPVSSGNNKGPPDSNNNVSIFLKSQELEVTLARWPLAVRGCNTRTEPRSPLNTAGEVKIMTLTGVSAGFVQTFPGY